VRAAYRGDAFAAAEAGRFGRLSLTLYDWIILVEVTRIFNGFSVVGVVVGTWAGLEDGGVEGEATARPEAHPVKGEAGKTTVTMRGGARLYGGSTGLLLCFLASYRVLNAWLVI
jgi:hypothetical protein